MPLTEKPIDIHLNVNEGNFAELGDAIATEIANNNDSKSSFAVKLTLDIGFEDAVYDGSIQHFSMQILALRDEFNLIEHPITFVNFARENFQEDAMLAMISNPLFMSLLSDETFLKLSIYSEAIVAKFLHTDYLAKGLSEINVDHDRQSYPASCAARSILKAEIELGMRPIANYNAKNELEIYAQIWEAPGKVADTQKLIAYLKRLNPNVEGIILDDVLGKTFQVLKDESLIMGFSFFTQQMPKIKSIQDVQDYSLPPDTVALVMVASNDPGGHLVYCQRDASNQIHFVDPGNGKVVKYHSFEALIEAEKGLGVVFELPKPAALLKPSIS